MLSFLARSPPRRKVSHLTTILYDEGASTVVYKDPSSETKLWIVNILPPATSRASVLTNTNSALAPPLHRHRYQDETFRILSGEAKFFLNGRERAAHKGQIVIIPKGWLHTFRNASTENELKLEFSLDPVRRERDEAYLRNAQTYRDDCRKHGITRSLPQVLLFMRRAEIIADWPGPSFVSQLVGVVLNFLIGEVVGKWLLGFSDTYPEYYNPKIL